MRPKDEKRREKPAVASASFEQWVMILFGMSGGLSFFTLTAVQSYRLPASGMALGMMAWLAWSGLPYNIRFFWQFLIDRVPIPYLSKQFGQRKAWGIVAHVGSTLGFCSLGSFDAVTHPTEFFLLAFITAFWAAIQDIVSSAYQFWFEPTLPLSQSVPSKTLGFRCGQCLATAVLPYLSAYWGWSCAHWLLALVKVVALGCILVLPEPKSRGKTEEAQSSSPPSIWKIVADLCRKPFVWGFLVVLVLMKGSETVLGAMQTEFMGYLKISSKQYGLFKNLPGFGAVLLGIFCAGRLARTRNAYTMLLMAVAGQSSAALLSLWLMHFQTSTFFIYILMVVSFIQEFFQGLMTTLSYLCLSLFSDRKAAVYNFTLLCTVGSLARLGWMHTLNLFTAHFGWQTLFALPLALYCGVFVVGLYLTKQKGFMKIFNGSGSRAFGPEKGKKAAAGE